MTNPPRRSQAIIFQWLDKRKSGYDRWCFRQIKSDGAFYGDVTKFDIGNNLHINIEGRLAGPDLQLLNTLVSQIKECAAADAPDPTTTTSGLIAIGSPQDPQVLFRYELDPQLEHETADLFLQIVEILRPYAS